MNNTLYPVDFYPYFPPKTAVDQVPVPYSCFSIGEFRNVDEKYLESLASNPLTSQETLYLIAKVAQYETLEQMMDNPQVDDAFLQRLAIMKSAEVQSLVVRHPKASGETIRKVYNNAASNGVKTLVAIRNNTPVDILSEIMKTAPWTIRAHILTRYDLPVEIIRLAAGDENHAVRTQVAKHKHTPADVLSNLLWDDNDFVSSLAVLNPNTSVEDVINLLDSENPHPPAIIYALHDLKLPERFYEKYSIHKEVLVRNTVAESSNTPRHILTKLAFDEDTMVASKAKHNANAEPWIRQLAALTDDDNK